MWRKGKSSAMLVGIQALWKAVQSFLKKLKMDLPFDPVIPLLGIYPKNPQNTYSKEYAYPYIHSSCVATL